MESKKLEILNRLTKEGYITLDEALILLETEKEIVWIPTNNSNPWQSTPNPYTPNRDWPYKPYEILYNFQGAELYPINN